MEHNDEGTKKPVRDSKKTRRRRNFALHVFGNSVREKNYGFNRGVLSSVRVTGSGATEKKKHSSSLRSLQLRKISNGKRTFTTADSVRAEQ